MKMLLLLVLPLVGSCGTMVHEEALAHDPAECTCPEPPVLVCADGSEPFDITVLAPAAGEPQAISIEASPAAIIAVEPAEEAARQEAVQKALEAIEQYEEYDEEHKAAPKKKE